MNPSGKCEHTATISNFKYERKEVTDEEIKRILEQRKKTVYRKVIKEDENGNFNLWLYFNEGAIVGVMKDREFPPLYINEKLLSENKELRRKYVVNPHEKLV